MRIGLAARHARWEQGTSPAVVLAVALACEAMRVLPSASVWTATVVLAGIWVIAVNELVRLRSERVGRDRTADCDSPHAPHAAWVSGHIVLVEPVPEATTAASLAEHLGQLAESDTLLAGSIVLGRGWAAAPALAGGGLRAAAAAIARHGVRLVVWVSPFVLSGSADHKELLRRGLLLTDGKEYDWAAPDGGSGTVRGSLLDLTHPEGVAWMRDSVLGPALAVGADGVLCDSADAVLIGLHTEWGRQGHVSQEQYSRAYYWSVFDEGRKLRGYDFVLMGPGVSSFPHTAQVALMPPDVGFSAWARWGAGCPLEDGELRAAAAAVFRSSEEGYVGSGIGPCKLSNLVGRAGLRAVQLSALLPAMVTEVGSPREAQDAVRRLARTGPVAINIAAHAELRPYLLTAAAGAWAAQREHATHAAVRHLGELPYFGPATDLAFRLGDDLVVCPAGGDGPVRCPLPPGGGWLRADARNTTQLSGNLTLPPPATGLAWVFKRAGAVLPLRPRGQLSPLLWAQYGMPAPDAAVLTVVIDAPTRAGSGYVAGTHRRESLCVRYRVGSQMLVELSPWSEPVLVAVRPLPIALPAEAADRTRASDAPLGDAAAGEMALTRVDSIWDLWAVAGSGPKGHGYFWHAGPGGEMWAYLPRTAAGSRLVFRAVG